MEKPTTRINRICLASIDECDWIWRDVDWVCAACGSISASALREYLDGEGMTFLRDTSRPDQPGVLVIRRGSPHARWCMAHLDDCVTDDLDAMTAATIADGIDSYASTEAAILAGRSAPRVIAVRAQWQAKRRRLQRRLDTACMTP